MGSNAPEVDCNCDRTVEYQDRQGYTFKRCIDCGREFRLTPTSPDDFDWEEVE